MSETLNFSSVADLWLNYKKALVKESTTALYACTLRKHLIPFFGTSPIITEDAVMAYIRVKKEEGLSVKFIKDSLVVLGMVCTYALKRGQLSGSRWRVAAGKTPRRNVEVLGADNYIKLLNYVRENLSPASLGIYICLSTGLRIGEVCGLMWHDFDPVAGLIRINRTVERIYSTDFTPRHTKLVIGTPKTESSRREIPLTDELMTVMNNLSAAYHPDHFIISGTTKPIEPRTYRSYYRKLCMRLNLPPLRFHALRHSFATLCVGKDIDYKIISSILGHSNISTTLNLYVHPGIEQKRRCLNELIDTMV